MFRLLVPSCLGRDGRCFPRLRCSGSQMLYMERALRRVRFQFSGPPQKRGFGCACVLCLPRPERFRHPEAWAHSPRKRYAFSLCGERPRQPEAWVPSPRVWRAFSLRGERPRQPEAWAHSPRVPRAFSLRGPRARRRSGLRESLDRNRGPVCSVGGGGFSGAEFAPFPSPLRPSSSGDGPALLWSFSVPLFCEPLALCSGRLIFPCSPTV